MRTTSIIPNTNEARRQRLRGLTLVELLVVMVILSLVTAATIPLMQPPTGDRKVREAARNVATTFELARARATETGRPAGVWIEPKKKNSSTNAIEAYKLFLCDVPPSYSGDSTNSNATINGANITLNNSGSASSLVKYGDRIRFNYRGAWYRITGGTDGTNIGGTFTIATGVSPDYASPPANTGTGSGVPFEIMRQPVKSSIAPTILTTNPPASIIDLTQSGGGATGVEFGQGADDTVSGLDKSQPVIVTFDPAGRVHQVLFYQGNNLKMGEPGSMMHFLVRLRKETNTPLTDLDAFWISINPYTGMVSVTASVGGGSLSSARALAIQGRIEGGL